MNVSYYEESLKSLKMINYPDREILHPRDPFGDIEPQYISPMTLLDGSTSIALGEGGEGVGGELS